MSFSLGFRSSSRFGFMNCNLYMFALVVGLLEGFDEP